MSRKIIVITLLIISAAGGPAFSSGQLENRVSDPLLKGIEEWKAGNLTEAASEFRQAAASDEPEIAAAAYYNHGTVLAELAGQSQEPEEKRKFLEESYQSLKRASEINRLPSARQKQVRQNMEIVREMLSQLPESPPDGQDNQNGQKGEQGEQPQDSKGSQDGQSQPEQGGQNPEELLERQRDLSSRSQAGEGRDQELAEEQKQLQKASEAENLNEAALNQSKAAEALRKGNRDEAAEYQKAAEQALAEAADDGSEADDILNQEAENEAQRNRIDEMGGITDAERNW